MTAETGGGGAQTLAELEEELERRAAVHGECEHSRAAYRDAARLVEEYAQEAVEA